ncbi:MAG: hydroxymethylpyrimidine/phosphomethylpyrimidine kinase [Candidatus Competibacteraceae bacterium]|nr:hydroxymethylpyrimidine/phosphomethylpyrimidine kinase [Candidatus Competibacteraceae bacterium]MBK7983958.1 hydroxymethylpyrimidine/phosphomethylpyrimidine kinase [Candidatus Competibacteraceae bacterium]MBK8897500.1 hydroxymethylpyrimidine/phosphomethylpyrimidine kinase [Candidatus Competibacteraceae bacterium]MBK8963652.1 hydroxymethylpyrimidine/phosphomethylpyrimidine kinase [Candidatus Competibacteraceae bacterium]MBK9950543.1 hydroxymethylpyrimidine/phosphomethylpyrimidine kinase [Cand
MFVRIQPATQSIPRLRSSGLIPVNPASIPVVMTLAGNDPSGGAGLCADIETLVSLGCHPAPVVTALTVQDTHNVKALLPVDAKLVLAQANAILNDMPVAAFKIGVIGSAENAAALHTLLSAYPKIPVVLDPVLAAGGGTELADKDLVAAIQTLLLPLTTVLTPNSIEARRLAPEADTLNACAMALLARGCQYVLITGGHEPSDEVINNLYGNNRLLDTFRWPRLPDSYHGSGCTLAAAIAALLAQGHEPHSSTPLSALLKAQNYTWRSLEAGYKTGGGQWLPNRLFWATSRGDRS